MKTILIFAHKFFVCEGLNRDMYIGSDLASNSNFKAADDGTTVTIKPPKRYLFKTDPININGLKTIDFLFSDAFQEVTRFLHHEVKRMKHEIK